MVVYIFLDIAECQQRYLTYIVRVDIDPDFWNFSKNHYPAGNFLIFFLKNKVGNEIMKHKSENY